MKKLVIIFSILLCLFGCSSNETTDVSTERYLNLINIINENDVFLEESNYYDISVEMAKIDDGYRYYVIIDNANISMYNIEALAIEKNVDYSEKMAANIGIFEETEYNMVPNQTNPDKGYVQGLVASGLTDKAKTTIYIMVQWYDKDYANQYREFFKLKVEYENLYG